MPFSAGIVIETVKCGRAHVLMVDKAYGNLYGMGSNEHGQLGQHKTVKSSAQPKLIAQISEPHLIECGADSSYAVTQDGSLYAWGLNDYG